MFTTQVLKKPPMGHYPVALIPGQFVDYYKPFTPEQMRYLPLNSATAGPPEEGMKLQDIKPPEPPAPEPQEDNEESDDDDTSSSSSSSSSGSSSSSSDSEAEEEEDDKNKVYVRELRRPIGEKEEGSLKFSGMVVP